MQHTQAEALYKDLSSDISHIFVGNIVSEICVNNFLFFTHIKLSMLQRRCCIQIKYILLCISHYMGQI